MGDAGFYQAVGSGKDTMTKIDLITGFLGSGKTTFLKRYAGWLLDQGQKIGIIENDFGAVNVDMLLLQDLEERGACTEMVVGGDPDCYRRRFRTKLIALGMQGLDRVLIEPSGIYDADEFFDVLCDEPLSRSGQSATRRFPPAFGNRWTWFSPLCVKAGKAAPRRGSCRPPRA